MYKLFERLNITLFIFNVFAIAVFALRATDFIDDSILAFHLSGSHFVWRSLIFFSVIMFWIFYNRKKNLVNGLELQLSIFLLLSALTFDNLGNLIGWYRIGTERGIHWYDDFTHFINTFLVTGFAYIWFDNLFPKSDRRLLAIASIGLTVTLGGLFEIMEVMSDKYGNTRMVAGVMDTTLDMIMNFTGAILMIGLIALYMRFRKKSKS